MAVACEGLTVSDSKPIALEIIAPPDSIHVNDTTAIHVRVLNRSGDSIVGAPVRLVSLTPDTLGIDSSRIAIVGLQAGPGKFVAFSGSLPSVPITVIVK